MKILKIECKHCKGIGYVSRRVKNDQSIKIQKKAFEMRKKGYTYREIQKELGFTHPQIVYNLVKKYEKIPDNIR